MAMVNECVQCFFRALSRNVKVTDTRADAHATVRPWVTERVASPSLLTPSSPSCSSSPSSGLLHSRVSSSLTSRGGPRVCPSRWLRSLALRWAFSTASRHTLHLQDAETRGRTVTDKHGVAGSWIGGMEG